MATLPSCVAILLVLPALCVWRDSQAFHVKPRGAGFEVELQGLLGSQVRINETGHPIPWSGQSQGQLRAKGSGHVIPFSDGSQVQHRQGKTSTTSLASSTSESSATSLASSTSETTSTPVTRAQCECGLVNRATRILGGVETEVHEYPWQASLTYKDKNSPNCGAAIIADRWVLTAAHCVGEWTTRNADVVVGEHRWSTASETSATKRISIAQVVIHPRYSIQTIDNDIALLRLATPIAFNGDNKVAPVCLPPPGELYASVQATVTGWGITKSGVWYPAAQLMEVKANTMTNAECARRLGNKITANMICAGVDEGGKGACHGDSGGAMVTPRDDSRMEVIGLVSWGRECGSAYYPVVFTRVNNYLEWMAGYTSGSVTCSPTRQSRP